jgi:3'(2'), 5'-bisphosphate nucleotidase
MLTTTIGMLVKERAVALDAVQRAMSVCQQVYCHLHTDDTEYKSDASPVTVADYAAQAVMNTVLTDAFPNVKIVGEEDATSLRDLQQPHVAYLRERITTLANSVLESKRTTEQVSSLRLMPTIID